MCAEAHKGYKFENEFSNFELMCAEAHKGYKNGRGIRLKIKIFNREICVRALLDTNSLCAKSSAEMR